MATGNVQDWTGNIADIGPIYPFVGSEMLLWIIGLVLWIGWHVVQTRRENAIYREEAERYGDPETLRKLVADSSQDPGD